MIKLDTKTDDLMYELKVGNEKCLSWWFKYFGGRKKVEKMVEGLEKKARETKKTVSSEVVEYIDKNGNRWRMFEKSTYYEDVDFVHTGRHAFVYYETLGSCGAYMPSFDASGELIGCLIFTSHFFLRMCQRLEIEYRSSSMIAKFVELMSCFATRVYETERKGMKEAAVALMGSAGFGVVRTFEPSVIEIDTFLTIPEMSNKQKKRIEPLYKMKYTPRDVSILRSLNKSTEEVVDDAFEMFKSLGLDEKTTNDLMLMILSAISYFSNKGLADDTEIAILQYKNPNIARSIQEKALCATRRMNGGEYKDPSALMEMAYVAEYAAVQYKIKDFDVFDYMNDCIVKYFNAEPMQESTRKDVMATYSEYKKRCEEYEEEVEEKVEKELNKLSSKKY